jgi:hypothetical protein
VKQDDQLRQRAYEIWLAEGQPVGQELDHWFQAREELIAYKALGVAEYEAFQTGSTVTIKASGVLPSAAFSASLEPNRLEPGDSRNGNAFVGYVLMFRRRVVGTREGQPVRFEIQTSFEYRGSVFELLVYDRDGEHRLFPNGKKAIRTDGNTPARA